MDDTKRVSPDDIEALAHTTQPGTTVRLPGTSGTAISDENSTRSRGSFDEK